MKKTNLIIFCVCLVVLIFIAGLIFFMYNQKSRDLTKVSDSQIISLLNKNSDARDYIKEHPDFKIKDKEVLTEESILAGRKGPNFKEVYQVLSLENNRYMRVDLIDKAGDRGLIAVIDFKTNQVPNAYLLLLFTRG